jgi:hypothetical protein
MDGEEFLHPDRNRRQLNMNIIISDLIKTGSRHSREF